MNIALLIALTLARPTTTVSAIYHSVEVDPVLACAVVEWESAFLWQRRDGSPMVHVNADGSKDWRYWQICDKYHEPYAYNRAKHIAQGAKIFTKAYKDAHGDPFRTLVNYNGSSSYPAHVLAIYYRLQNTIMKAKTIENGLSPSNRADLCNLFLAPHSLPDFLLPKRLL